MKVSGFDPIGDIKAEIRAEAEKGARKATEQPIKFAILLAALALYEATKKKKRGRR